MLPCMVSNGGWLKKNVNKISIIEIECWDGWVVLQENKINNGNIEKKVEVAPIQVKVRESLWRWNRHLNHIPVMVLVTSDFIHVNGDKRKVGR